MRSGEDITQVNCICFPPVQATTPMSTTLPRTMAGGPTSPSTTFKSTTPPHTYTPERTSSGPDTTASPGSTPLPQTTNPGTAHPLHSTSSGKTSAPVTTRYRSAMPPPPTSHWFPSWRPISTIPPFIMQPPPPSLNILFDFSSNKICIQGKTTQTKVLTQNTCQEGFFYDPFLQSAEKLSAKCL